MSDKEYVEKLEGIIKEYKEMIDAGSRIINSYEKMMLGLFEKTQDN